MRTAARSGGYKWSRAPDRISKPGRSKVQTGQRGNHQLRPSIRKVDETRIGFGDLPAELRNLIYQTALKPSPGRFVRIVQQPPGIAKTQLALGLLGSCKAIRAEAWHFFYENNSFRIDSVLTPIQRTKIPPEIDPCVIDANTLRYVWTSYAVRTVKNYEADLKRFIDCTNYKRGLHAIREISVAYYYQDTRTSDGEIDRTGSFPEKADAVLHLQLLPKRPYYRLAVNRRLSSETDEERLLSALEDMDCTMRGLLDFGTVPKPFSKHALQEVAEQWEKKCDFYKIGKD